MATTTKKATTRSARVNAGPADSSRKSSDESNASAKRARLDEAPAKRVEEVKQRLRIKIKAYDSKIIDTSCRQIVDIALRNGAEIVGPVPLPTEIHRYTVNRSTFVHKDSREQFEMRSHKRLIDILNPNPKIIDALMNLNLPAGVDIEIKM